jgi:hypothetical protein
MNKSDGQVESMGLDRATLDQINRKAILLNVQARRGENIKSESGMWPGYDPALQVCTLKSRIIVKVLVCVNSKHTIRKCQKMARQNTFEILLLNDTNTIGEH